MTDRFDLEQKILKMFDVVTDIRLVNDFVGDDRFEALAKVWELKIEDMWQTFEEYVKTDAVRKLEQEEKDGNVE